MDLIFTDAGGTDRGVLEAYTLDMAYGNDENNFECTVDASDHCCPPRSLIYVEGEEYGGIVDSIAVDTESETIKYKGRTWHGILEGKAICPPPGEDYLVLSGDANAVLGQLILMLGLADMFEASADESDVTISAYQFPRYVYGYRGIRDMLKANGGKLHVEWRGDRVWLSALPAMDYSQDEEFDASQTTFVLEKQYRPINHVLCLGQGDLAQRAVLHVFCDENGGIQPFATVADPVEDGQYITDESQRVLSGTDEVIEILDYSSAEIVTNYILLTAKPSDWDANCTAYFVKDTSEEGYKAVELEAVGYELQKIRPYDWAVNFQKYFTRSGDNYNAVAATTVYNLLSAKPSDWAAKYETYFTRSGSTYRAVAGTVTESYVRQSKKPSDWWTKYASYYSYYSDGVTSEYKAVSGVTYYEYKVQTQRPTDWAAQFSGYYRKATAKELKAKSWVKYYPVDPVVKKTTDSKGNTTTTESSPAWAAKKYYTRFQREHAPDWSAAARYTYVKKESAPAWAANTYYEKDTDAAPTWAANTYYTKTEEMVPPKWVSGTYFRQALDHYATMAENAVQRLLEAHEAAPMEISLDETDNTYDIGDTVGVLEPTTGITATQEIVKKIVKITNDDIKITYEVK